MDALTSLLTKPLEAASAVLAAAAGAPDHAAAGPAVVQGNATFTEDTLRMLLYNLFHGDSRLQSQVFQQYYSPDVLFRLNGGMLEVRGQQEVQQLLRGSQLMASCKPEVLEISSSADKAVILLNLNVSYYLLPLTWYYRIPVATTITLVFGKSADTGFAAATASDVITEHHQEMSICDLFWWNPALEWFSRRVWGPVSGPLLSRFVNIEEPIVDKYTSYLEGGAGHIQALMWSLEDRAKAMGLQGLPSAAARLKPKHWEQRKLQPRQPPGPQQQQQQQQQLEVQQKEYKTAVAGGAGLSQGPHQLEGVASGPDGQAGATGVTAGQPEEKPEGQAGATGVTAGQPEEKPEGQAGATGVTAGQPEEKPEGQAGTTGVTTGSPEERPEGQAAAGGQPEPQVLEEPEKGLATEAAADTSGPSTAAADAPVTAAADTSGPSTAAADAPVTAAADTSGPSTAAADAPVTAAADTSGPSTAAADAAPATGPAAAAGGGGDTSGPKTVHQDPGLQAVPPAGGSSDASVGGKSTERSAEPSSSQPAAAEPGSAQLAAAEELEGGTEAAVPVDAGEGGPVEALASGTAQQAEATNSNAAASSAGVGNSEDPSICSVGHPVASEAEAAAAAGLHVQQAEQLGQQPDPAGMDTAAGGAAIDAAAAGGAAAPAAGAQLARNASGKRRRSKKQR